MGLIIGWSLLVASWVAPRFIKDDDKKRFWGLVLSAMATGVFLGLFF